VRKLRRIGRDERGASVVEFALLAPVLVGFIIAISQLGLLFYANAGLGNAVSEGARLATLFPRPTNEQIAARINERRFGLDPAYVVGPTIVDGSDNGTPYADITMSYAAPLNFIFYKVGPIRLTRTRRVYTQPTS
jgi:Flp pilus assembly protein TadG